jgi:gliding motility-associated-like protein
MDETYFSDSVNPYHVYLTYNHFDNVTLVVTNDRGCSDSITDNTVFIKGPLEIDFKTDTACYGKPTHFLAFVNSPVGGTVLNWQWHPLSLGGPDSTTVDSLYQFTYPSPGTFIASITAMNAAGCTDSIARTVVVNPLPVVDFIFDTTCCIDSTHFIDITSPANGNIIWRQWIFGHPASGVLDTVYNLASTAHLYPPYSANYQVTLTVMNADSCINSITKTVFHCSCMTGGFDFDSIHCAEQPIQFFDESIFPPPIIPVAWEWNFGDPASGIADTSSLQNPVHIFGDPGTYTVTLVVHTTVSGISSTDTIYNTIYIYPVPVVDFYPDPEVTTVMNPVIEFINLSPLLNNPVFHWNFGDNSFDSIYAPIHEYIKSGIYTVQLTVTNDNHCIGTESHFVYIKPETTFYIPNSFTPNGNGVNDKFGVLGSSIDPSEFRMIIATRWGEVVYETNDPDALWDGKNQRNGEMCPVGVYVYYVKLKELQKDDNHELKGHVLLLRAEE